MSPSSQPFPTWTAPRGPTGERAARNDPTGQPAATQASPPVTGVRAASGCPPRLGFDVMAGMAKQQTGTGVVAWPEWTDRSMRPCTASSRSHESASHATNHRANTTPHGNSVVRNYAWSTRRVVGLVPLWGTGCHHTKPAERRCQYCAGQVNGMQPVPALWGGRHQMEGTVGS